MTAPLLDFAAAAARLDVSPRQLRNLVLSGRLAFVNVGLGLKRPAYRFREADLAAFQAQSLQQCQPKPPESTGEKAKKRGHTTLSCDVIDFADRLRQRTERTPSVSSPRSGRKKPRK